MAFINLLHLFFVFYFFFYFVFGKKLFLFQIGLSAFDGFCLQKIDNISWHFIDCGIVKLLNVIEGTSIVIGDEVNSYTLTTESSTATDSM